MQGAAKMVNKASRKKAGEELVPAPKRQRQEQQGPRLIEAALPPPLQMGFVHSGSRGNNPRRGGGRVDGRGRCVGGDSSRGGYGLGDG